MQARHGHFMPPSLLDSQLEPLEPLATERERRDRQHPRHEGAGRRPRPRRRDPRPPPGLTSDLRPVPTGSGLFPTKSICLRDDDPSNERPDPRAAVLPPAPPPAPAAPPPPTAPRRRRPRPSVSATSPTSPTPAPSSASQRGTFQKALGSATTVKTSVFDAGPTETEALLSGSLDIGFIGPGPVVNAYAKSKAVRVSPVPRRTEPPSSCARHRPRPGSKARRRHPEARQHPGHRPALLPEGARAPDDG